MKGFIAELRRRHVFKVAELYAVVAWVLAQGAVLLAWAFDLTPEGVKRTHSLPATRPGLDILHFPPATPVAANPGAGAVGDAPTARDLIQKAQRGIDEYGYAGLQPRTERLLQRL